jgi:hypothetical protein
MCLGSFTDVIRIAISILIIVRLYRLIVNMSVNYLAVELDRIRSVPHT